MGDIVKHGWSEQEMRAALRAFLSHRQRMCVPPQPDDDDLVIAGTIDEVLSLRAENAKLRAVEAAAEPALVLAHAYADMAGGTSDEQIVRDLRAALEAGKEGGDA